MAHLGPIVGPPNPVPILRPFRWLATVLQTFRERPLPGSYAPLITPTVDTFGTEIFGQEIESDSIQSALGGIELVHTRVPQGTIRQYISLEWFHDDLAGTLRRLQLIRVIERTGGFAQFAFHPDRVMDGDGGGVDQERDAMQMVIGMPDEFLGVRATAMGGGARLTLRLIWIDMPVGEYMAGFANR